MKLFKTAIFTVSAVLLFASCSNKYKNDTKLAVEDGKTVVERYGQLQVIGTDLCNKDGQPVQLRGMSSHGLQWYGKFANENVIGWLRDDWNCQLWRAAMYISEGGYLSSKAIKTRVTDSVEAAIKLGVYVIIDWHVLGTKDPLAHVEQAKDFFDEMSKTYGSYPNIIYEICNEPNGEKVTWKDSIKPYAEQVIKTIRANDPNNIIIVGTPVWSSQPQLAAKDPIKADNIMYTVHFYAGTHGKTDRKNIKEALKLGAPVFCTEWGTTMASGDGGVFEKSTLEWMKFFEENNISWANWAVNNKGEDSGILGFNKDRDGKGGWTEKDLSPDGKLIRKILRNEIK